MLTDQIMSKQSAITVLVVLTTLTMAVIIGYVSWRLVRRKYKTDVIVKDPRRMFDNVALRVGAYKIPETRAGQEFAFSMWLYMADFQPTALAKPILMRGNGSAEGGDRFVDTSPVVFMDSGSNKMYVAVRTNRRAAQSGVEPSTLMDIVNLPKSSNPYVVVTIDYVPMQRWVHVVFSVQDYLLTVFMDGSIYAVENLVDGTYSEPSIRPMFAACTGEVVVGTTGESAGAEMRGFVSKLAFMNYAPLLDQVVAMYKSGPGSNSVLAMLGLDQYGVRTPIYKLGYEDTQMSNN